MQSSKQNIFKSSAYETDYSKPVTIQCKKCKRDYSKYTTKCYICNLRLWNFNFKGSKSFGKKWYKIDPWYFIISN